MKRSPSVIVGLAIVVLLAVSDATLPFGGDGRPMPIAVSGAVLGVLTLVGVVLYWRGWRAGAPVIVLSRILSAVITLPTVLMSGVSTADRVVAALILILTTIATYLVIRTMKDWNRAALRGAS